MNIPSLSDLKNSILADIQNALGTTTTLGKKVINAFSAVQAATIKLLYIQNSRVYKNIFLLFRNRCEALLLFDVQN